MPIDNELTEDQYDIYGRGYAAGLKQGSDIAYEKSAAEIARLRAWLSEAYTEDKPTQFPTWSETYAETLPRHGEDEAVS